MPWRATQLATAQGRRGASSIGCSSTSACAARGEFARLVRNFPGEFESALRGREMDDHGMIGRAALSRVQTRHGFGAGGVRAQAVDGFGGESNQPARAQDLRRVTDF